MASHADPKLRTVMQAEANGSNEPKRVLVHPKQQVGDWLQQWEGNEALLSVWSTLPKSHPQYSHARRIAGS